MDERFFKFPFLNQTLFIISWLIASLLPASTNARNYLEQPEGSCVDSSPIAYGMRCQIIDSSTFGFDFSIDTLTFDENSRLQSTNKYWITEAGGLFVEDILMGGWMCYGITSPWSVAQGSTLDFKTTEGTWSFSEDLQSALRLTFRTRGVDFIRYSCAEVNAWEKPNW